MQNVTLQTELEIWENPTEYELKNADPMTLVPRVFANYAKEQGDLLRVLTSNVMSLSADIQEVSEFMSVVNEGTSYTKNKTDGDVYWFKFFETEEEAMEEMERWVTVGAQPESTLTRNSSYNGYDEEEGDSIAPINVPQWGDGTLGVVIRQFTDNKTPGAIPPGGTYMEWGMYMAKGSATTMTENLRNRANDLTTLNQQAQLSVQTIMGRMNATIELISNIIKKNTTQLESLLSRFTR